MVMTMTKEKNKWETKKQKNGDAVRAATTRNGKVAESVESAGLTEKVQKVFRQTGVHWGNIAYLSMAVLALICVLLPILVLLLTSKARRRKFFLGLTRGRAQRSMDMAMTTVDPEDALLADDAEEIQAYHVMPSPR